MATKKTFEAVAAALSRVTTNPARSEAARQTASDIARDLAFYFAADNPRFDRARFYRACGVTEAK